ncbi:bifunctional diaminohydroxyphosphoribosylaminopyrimidine deaminase/5-amino-6-(5-phosphoribosylamino)uracil reductase RibD [Acidimangrovimonas sediminis]|uniref:bifunctional diaminohydroxyphosphoribosylaminopyrimidine deaminase/5-amino-6-(5-phosphoribosylamino)uracil reductase RibD n=1 Tax=Acidimangrovimonas sediminis TaxID=2056283 RepID=UPI001E454E73|nr:bifunctional diaminohydroxyphosphoribosylaminopyrimidine deaminase/5-amino-6-(5-phosphoribosylamino)uracil reductase RibD [Acidimangrovimonas sediminis]
MNPAAEAEGDRRFMWLALTLGRRGQGRCWPNPAVGCVLVRDGRVVGRGWTQPGGRPHAEVVALAQAGEAARGATAYVTLEPCAHHGKTPPCAKALVGAGVARVVTALGDPDPRVAGRGHDILRAAGIAVTEGVEATAARRDHAGFLSRVTQGRPLLTLKLASSLDGRIATASGESRWITGAEARRRVHAQRMAHDAVLVGGGTARADDPLLTVRDMGAAVQPVRVIAARRLDLPDDGRLAGSLGEAPLWLAHDPGQTREAAATRWQGLGARLLPVAAGVDGQLDPLALLGSLGQAGLTRVYCEGGGALAASLLSAGAVDRLVVFQAGLALGAEGRPALGALGLGALAEAPRFRQTGAEAVGADVMTTWERA